ncbi:unnamed protein product [Urochloa humidicola]
MAGVASGTSSTGSTACARDVAEVASTTAGKRGHRASAAASASSGSVIAHRGPDMVAEKMTQATGALVARKMEDRRNDRIKRRRWRGGRNGRRQPSQCIVEARRAR